jgi:hypothetical protein
VQHLLALPLQPIAGKRLTCWLCTSSASNRLAYPADLRVGHIIGGDIRRVVGNLLRPKQSLRWALGEIDSTIETSTPTPAPHAPSDPVHQGGDSNRATLASRRRPSGSPFGGAHRYEDSTNAFGQRVEVEARIIRNEWSFGGGRSVVANRRPITCGTIVYASIRVCLWRKQMADARIANSHRLSRGN